MMSTIKQKRRRIQTDAASISDVVKKYHQLPQGMNFEEERELQRVATRGGVCLCFCGDLIVLLTDHKECFDQTNYVYSWVCVYFRTSSINSLATVDCKSHM